MFGLIGKLTTVDGQRDKLIELLLQGAEILGQSDGCLQYAINEDKTHDNTVWVLEYWKSAEDHQASLANEDIRAIIGQAGPLLAEAPQGFEISPKGGVGVPEGN